MFLEIVRSNNERYTKNYYVKFIMNTNASFAPKSDIIKFEKNGLVVALQNENLEKNDNVIKKAFIKAGRKKTNEISVFLPEDRLVSKYLFEQITRLDSKRVLKQKKIFLMVEKSFSFLSEEEKRKLDEYILSVRINESKKENKEQLLYSACHEINREALFTFPEKEEYVSDITFHGWEVDIEKERRLYKKRLKGYKNKKGLQVAQEFTRKKTRKKEAVTETGVKVITSDNDNSTNSEIRENYERLKSFPRKPLYGNNHSPKERKECMEMRELPQNVRHCTTHVFSETADFHDKRKTIKKVNNEDLNKILDKARKINPVIEFIIDKEQKLGISTPEGYKRAGVSKQTWSNMQKPKSRVKKETLFSFVVGLKMNMEEAAGLLSCAGFTFSPTSDLDLIVKYCIEHTIYDKTTINSYLFDKEQPLLCVG